MNKFIVALKHCKTILIHKKYVFFFSRKLGIGWQGFWHDLSKFSPVEFLESINYYTGTSSPIDNCKKDKGYSMAWLHHKGHNKHHYEHWQDNFDKGGEPLCMPDKYVKEMICDYLAAGRAYKGKDFDFNSEWIWWVNKTSNPIAMNPNNKLAVDSVLCELNTRFGSRRITDLDNNDWKYFRRLVEDSINLYRG